MQNSRDLFVSIVVPVLDEERYIGGALASLIPRNPDFEYEILVMDGGSRDLTSTIVDLVAAGNPRVKLIPNERRIQAAAVNIGAKAADPRSRYILRADCHAQYPANFVVRAAEAAKSSNAASVVVAMHTHGVTCFQRAVAAAQGSIFGNGGAAHRRKSASGFVDHGHHALFDREIFLSLGGYDESFSHNEDAEYDMRLTRAGHKIWMMGETPITYFPRSSPSSLASQYFNYGWGRASTVLKHRAPLKARQMFPVFALLTCALAFSASPFLPIALVAPALYLCACVAAGIVLGIQEKSACAGVFGGVALVTMHMSWALGFLSRVAARRTRAATSPLIDLTARTDAPSAK